MQNNKRCKKSITTWIDLSFILYNACICVVWNSESGQTKIERKVNKSLVFRKYTLFFCFFGWWIHLWPTQNLTQTSQKWIGTQSDLTPIRTLSAVGLNHNESTLVSQLNYWVLFFSLQLAFKRSSPFFPFFSLYFIKINYSEERARELKWFCFRLWVCVH